MPSSSALVDNEHSYYRFAGGNKLEIGKPGVDDKKLIRVLKALSDPNRFRMVQEVASAGELSCGQIVERFSLSQPTISHHMKILTEADVLWVRREGQHGFISVNHALLSEIATLLPRRLSSKGARRATAQRARSRDNHA